MTREIELKLRLAPVHLPQLRRALRRLAGAPARPQNLTSLYFDTPQLHLRQAGAALRVRKIGRRWVQTLKGGGAVQGGLHVREEREWPVMRAQPDLTKLKDTALPWEDIGAQLVPVFETTFRRTLWDVVLGDSHIEVALDRGHIQAGAQREDLLELELELKSGAPSALYDFASALAAAVPLAPDPVSKAERGYRLFQGQALAPVKAGTPALAPTMTAEQAFIAILWNCVDQMQRNQRGVAEQSDPEFIHQMRVALRRLRSALSLFAPLVPRASWLTWAEEARWLAGELGAARDWDVLAEELLPPLLDRLQHSKPLEYLPQRVADERQRARGRARDAVFSPRCGLLALTIGQWLSLRPWRSLADAAQLAQLDGAVTPIADTLLLQRHAQLRRRGRRLMQLSDERRHRVRVTAKKLRYAAEFFVALYPRKAVRADLRKLAALQDVLGGLNDHATALNRAAQLCQETRDVRCREEAGILIGWSASVLLCQSRQLEKAWKAYRRHPFFIDR